MKIKPQPWFKSSMRKGLVNMRCLLSISLFAVLLSLLVVSSAKAVYPINDLNDDTANMSDLALQADQLQQTGIPLVINEFVASNNSSALDPQDQYDDWIEIW